MISFLLVVGGENGGRVGFLVSWLLNHVSTYIGDPPLRV
jgi:hypothetical protein